MPDIDPQLFREIVAHAKEIKNAHGSRDEQALDMEKLYRLDWADKGIVEGEAKDIRATIAPGPRIAVQGITRLMSSSDITVNVPFDTNDPEAKEQSEPLEKMARAMWKAASRIAGFPLHRDAILSQTLYDEVHIGIVSTRDLMARAENLSPATVTRAKAIHDQTPYLFEVMNPRNGYPEMDSMGLTAYYRESSMTTQQLRSLFGENADACLGDAGRYKVWTMCDWWDLTNRAVWVDGKETPILCEEHGLPFIPIVVRIGEGSRMFQDIEDQREPFLLTEYKSGMWNRLNLALTAFYTIIYRLGLGPAFVEQLSNANAAATTIDAQAGFQRYLVPPGNTFSVMANKGLLDPAFQWAVTYAEGKEPEMTLFRQALGQPLAGATSFSEVALVAQAGRLPVIPIQMSVSWAIADALKMALMWLKKDGYKGKAREGDQKYELYPKDIPQNFDLEVTLDVRLPQDKLQQANIASMLAKAGLMSNRMIQETLLNIPQSEDMQQEIWTEQALNAMFGVYVQGQAQKMMQAMSAPPPQPPGMQPGMGGPAPQAQTPPGGLPPGGIPPTPGLQGIPPEMAMMGGQGPEMPPGMSEEPGLEQMMGLA